MLTANQVIATSFSHGRRGAGYDEIEVDDFLDRVATTLRGYESGEVPADAVTVSDIERARFTPARGFGRRGYDNNAVDALLTQARETLRVHESRGGRRAPRAGDTGPDAARRDAAMRDVGVPGEYPSSPVRSAVTMNKPGPFSRLFKG